MKENLLDDGVGDTLVSAAFDGVRTTRAPSDLLSHGAIDGLSIFAAPDANAVRLLRSLPGNSLWK
jgi:hypothetical protein